MSVPSAVLVINSKDRVSGTSAQYDVNVPRALDLSPYSTFYVESVAMRGGSYDITSSTNIFWMAILTYNGALQTYNYEVFAATIPPGSYSPDQIAAALTVAITDSFSATFPAAPLLSAAVSYDNATNLMVVQSNGSTYRAPNTGATAVNTWFAVLDSSSRWVGMPFRGSLNEGLGFETLSYPPATWNGIVSYIGSLTNKYSGSAQVCYQQLPQLLLCTSWSRGRVYMTDEIDERATAAVVSVPAFGASGVWETAYPLRFNLIGQDLKNLSIWWRSTDGTRAEFGSATHTITLRFE